jgi:hypothetical protein
MDDCEGRAKASARRRWLKCNFPIFLDVIVAIYIYLTFVLLSEWALMRQYEDAIHAPTPIPSPTEPTGAHRARRLSPFSRRGPPAKPYEMNVFASVLEYLGFGRLAWLCSPLPDAVVAIVLAFLTLRALHIAALSDPGEVPEHYEAPEGFTTPGKVARMRAACSASGEGDGLAITSGAGGAPEGTPVVNSAAVVDLKCTPGGGAAKRLTMPGTAGPPPVPMYNSRYSRPYDPHYCYECAHDRPLRTHHCRYCNVCVVRFDHHCDWIDNCVGARNHKCFVLFIGYIFASIGHFIAMFFRWCNSSAVIILPDLGTIMHLILLCGYLFIVFPCAFLAGIFLVNTVWGLLRDETTIESTHPSRYGATVGMAGHRYVTRMRSVMGPSAWLWLWPDLQPLRLPGMSVTAPPTAVLGHGIVSASGGKIAHTV